MATCSRQPSVGSAHEEIDILKSIYLDEIQEFPAENSARLIIFSLKPNVEDGQAKHYNSLQLEILIPHDYPLSPADITLKKPRGLTDEEVDTLKSQLLSFVHQNKGQPVLFDVIQMAQDFLSCSDVPKLPCSICLNSFHRNDEIFVTNVCRHHFHSQCLGRYIQHVLDEKNVERRSLPSLLKDSVSEDVGCPLCRCPMEYNLHALLNAVQPLNEADASTSSFDWSDLVNPIQRKHRDLYEKQKLQGGLIDIDEEQKRLLITEDTRIILPPSSSSATVNLVESSTETTVLAHPSDRLTDKESVSLDVQVADKPNSKKKCHPSHYAARDGAVSSNYYRRRYNHNNNNTYYHHGNTGKRQEFVPNRSKPQQPITAATETAVSKTDNDITAVKGDTS